jgi:signal peptidase I
MSATPTTLTTPSAAADANTQELIPTENIEGIKGIIIAFLMALVFRAFIIEGFEIPTGSMAPTLMGAQTIAHADASGYEWPVGPVSMIQGTSTPTPRQSYSTLDPMSRAEVRASDVPIRSGDRVFILKYLWPLYTPSRYDVVVFKNPRDPTMNYIKRLVGLGPEEVAIVDGDVFSRPIAADGKGEPATTNTWMLPGWTVTRKPESAQRVMWQAVFDTRYTPLNAVKDGRTWFRSPWVAEDASAKSWQIDGKSEYRYEGSGATSLSWDLTRRVISDYYPYNFGYAPSASPQPVGQYPVSDVRTIVEIKPDAAMTSVAFQVATRKHEFRISVDGTAATLSMRAQGATDWNQLGTGTLPAALEPGKVTSLEFWHSDQSLSLFVNSQFVARGDYKWTPNDRLVNTMGLTADEVFKTEQNLLMDGARITQPRVSVSFAGGPFTLVRLSLDRDIHYQAGNYLPVNDPTPSTRPSVHSRARQPSAATHPRQPVYLAEGEYFNCGDNSPASLDARLWDTPYPWVGQNTGKIGVIGRDAMIGRAFIVYWPGVYWKYSFLPIPDLGRVRQIR